MIADAIFDLCAALFAHPKRERHKDGVCVRDKRLKIKKVRYAVRLVSVRFSAGFMRSFISHWRGTVSGRTAGKARHSERGRSIAFTYNRCQKGFTRIRDELNLNSEHRPHDGQTHFVTAAKKNGADEYTIKYMVGHKISDITEKV